MLRQEEIMEQIVKTAVKDERIRAVLLCGSRANEAEKADEFSDFDIVYVVSELLPFWNNTAWIEEKFGRPAIMQLPDLMDAKPMECGNRDRFAYLMLFEDGNRIDLTIVPAPYLGGAEPTAVLIDKDGALKSTEGNDRYFQIKKPSEKEYADCCNEFWWCLNNVAKGIARRQLPYTMAMLHEIVRPMLDRMTEWYIGTCRKFSVSSGKMGKYFQKFLPDDIYAEYAATYSDGNYDRIWAAVQTMCGLFQKLACGVGQFFGYSYNAEEDSAITAYLAKIKSASMRGQNEDRE